MAERAGYNTVIKISGASTAFTATSTTPRTGGRIYTLNPARRAIDPKVPLVVYKSLEYPTPTTESYVIDYVEGAIVFDVSDENRGTIIASGNAFTMSTVATASSLSVNETCDLIDVTPFTATNKKRIAGLKSASGTITEFDVADETFTDAILAAEFLILHIYEVSTGEPRQYWAVFESSELQAAVEGAQTQVLSWQSHKEFGKRLY